jgi:hypothetical protein
MKYLAIALAIITTASSVTAKEICTSSFSETASYALKSAEFTSTPDFKTHDVINIGSDVFLLHLGTIVNDGFATHIVNVTSTTGSTAVIIGNIHVVNNRTVSSKFCTIVTETAL